MGCEMPKLAHGLQRKSEERVYYCYCCDRHYRSHGCNLCNGSACYQCLEWTYECNSIGDEWCVRMHVPLRTCAHAAVEVAHQVTVHA